MTHSFVQVGIAAAQQSADVASDDRSGLLARDRLPEIAVEERLELERAKLLDQVGSRLLAPLLRFGRRIRARRASLTTCRSRGSSGCERLLGGCTANQERAHAKTSHAGERDRPGVTSDEPGRAVRMSQASCVAFCRESVRLS